MPVSDDPYSRVYWRVLREFPMLAEDYALLGQWTHLLMIADQAYPGPAYLPMTAKKALVAHLTGIGIITVEGPTFTVRGLGKHREARSEAARQGASARWGRIPDGDARANATAMRPHSGGIRQRMPRRAETRRDETSLVEQPDADALDVYYRLTATWPSQKVTPWLSRLADDFGEEAVSMALAAEWKEDPDKSTLLSRTESRLGREAHEAEKARREREASEREAEARRIEEMPAEQRAANMRRLMEAVPAIAKAMP